MELPVHLVMKEGTTCSPTSVVKEGTTLLPVELMLSRNYLLNDRVGPSTVLV